MTRVSPVGIDLGTTNSAMARIDASGATAMIRNAEGETTTPSIVYFSEREVVVGKAARSAIVTHPDLVAQWVKRDMGAPFYSHPIRGRKLPPEVIQACILRKIKTDVVAAAGPETRVVITVPAYFDERRRKATADAGEMAGLHVLDIVNEPTAAALAFGEALGYLAPSGLPKEELNVLVYDLGGGTFDVTLLHLAMRHVTTLATDGDVQLGGHDWDQRLVDYAAEQFMLMFQVDPRKEPASLNRLYQNAMEAKHTLTARSRAAITVTCGGDTCDVPIEREKFEELTADLLERTAYTSRQVLTAAGLEWRDVHRVLLVGGSTRMPMVARMVEKMADRQPDRMVNPDEAVARGAALYARYLLGKKSGQGGMSVTNVNAHSLGVEGIDPETLRRKNIILIPRNTALPAKHSERFATKADGQQSIVIRVLEGESTQPSQCIAIGRTVVRDLPAGLPKGWPVEITFCYASNGRLRVDANVHGTQSRVQLNLEREATLTSEGLARWKGLVDAAAGVGEFHSTASGTGTVMPDSAADDEVAAWMFDEAPSADGSSAGGSSVSITPKASASDTKKPEVGSGASRPPNRPAPPASKPPPTRSASLADPATAPRFTNSPKPAEPAKPAVPPKMAVPPKPAPAVAPPPKPAMSETPRFVEVPERPAAPLWSSPPQRPAERGSTPPPRPKAGPPPLPVPQIAAPASSAAEAPKPVPRAPTRRKSRIPPWVIRLVGMALSGLLALAVGYLLISHFRPDLLRH